MKNNQLEPYSYYNKLHSSSNNRNIRSKLKNTDFGSNQVNDTKLLVQSKPELMPVQNIPTSDQAWHRTIQPQTMTHQTIQPQTMSHQTIQPQTIQPQTMTDQASGSSNCGLTELLKNIHLKMKIYIERLTDFIKNNWEFVLLLLILILLIYLIRFIRILYFKTNLICWNTCNINGNTVEDEDEDEDEDKDNIKSSKTQSEKKTVKNTTITKTQSNKKPKIRQINKNDFKNADDKKCVAYIRTDLLKTSDNKMNDNVVNIRKYLLI